MEVELPVIWTEERLADVLSWNDVLLPVCPNMVGGILLFSKALEGRMHRERMRKALAEDTLVRMVRKQAELLLEAEKVLKGRKGKEPGADAGSLRAELRRLDEAKISGYEDYKAGRMSRERFVEKKRELDIRRQEVSAAVSEAEAREAVEESGKREYREALWIREYLHLEGYDKRVMASLIESAKVMGEDRLEVVWKFGDVYEKILGEMR